MKKEILLFLSLPPRRRGGQRDTFTSEREGTSTDHRRSLRSLLVGGGNERDCSSLLAPSSHEGCCGFVSPKAGRFARGGQGVLTRRAGSWLRSAKGGSFHQRRARGAQPPRRLLALSMQCNCSSSVAALPPRRRREQTRLFLVGHCAFSSAAAAANEAAPRRSLCPPPIGGGSKSDCFSSEGEADLLAATAADSSLAASLSRVRFLPTEET